VDTWLSSKRALKKIVDDNGTTIPGSSSWEKSLLGDPQKGPDIFGGGKGLLEGGYLNRSARSWQTDSSAIPLDKSPSAVPGARKDENTTKSKHNNSEK